MKKIILIIPVTLLLYLAGCAPFPTVNSSKARIGDNTGNTKELISLPNPKEKIYCAVYKFRDQTGQYKASASGASWSTAVTQGATSILTKALEESGWFIPIEREGLSNLLNERKIIRSSRENFKSESETNTPDLPPLLFAGILLEGGIISYETNVYTGGIGLKYFGTGGSGTYRQDQVTIYLRAISTQNGRVLKTVHTTKTILSQAIDINFYRFVEVKKLLEAETGYSYNEPPQLCVTAAIEKAVQSLIIEGISDKYWQLENPDDINSKVIQDYYDEKAGIQSVELPDRMFGIGINFGGNILNSDYNYTNMKPALDGILEIPLTKDFAISGSAGISRLEAEKFFNSDIYYANINSKYYLYPESRLTPFVKAGAAFSYRFPNNSYYNKRLNFKEEIFYGVNAGLGIRYTILPNIDFNVTADNYYFFNDDIENVKNGRWNDYFWIFKTGFTYFFR